MNKHTPGPWVRSNNSVVSRKASCVVVRLPAQTDRVGDESPEQIERWDADARLIAASPELLEVLEEAIEQWMDENFYSEFPYHSKWAEKAQSVIAKAKGEEHKRRTGGTTMKDALARLIRIMGTFDLATGHADTMDQALDALESELRDVLGHLRARRE